MQTNNRNLTLTPLPNSSNVQVRVTYNVVFTPLERHMAQHGVNFLETIRVIGVDPPGGFSGTILHTFPIQVLPVPPAGPLVIARNRVIVVSRASLNEDPGIFDADEIRGRIEIRSIPSFTHQAFTDQEVLPGVIFPPLPVNEQE